MATDALSRRLRFDDPDPIDRDAIIPQEEDLRQWAAISRHGPLPLTYLAHFTSRKNFAKLQRRFTRFYHNGFLSRPPRQFESFHSRYSSIVYDLTPKARAMLGDKACPMPPARTASFVHQLMQACFTASLELAKGDDFIHREELLDRNNLTIELDGSKLIPDDVFALRLPSGKKQFFVVEIDRNTESIERNTGTYNTWKKKVADYDAALSGGLKRAYGIPTATILVVTTNATHAENIAAYVKANSRYADRWRFLVEPTFGLNWRMPKALLASAKEI
ncbi:MAG: replication-relaxation family protein [Sphingomonas sp.]|uniref:replication-relaxation family protein n=1 Tax=Sphingomonas sp. TaxID=28214 RepID=UPI001AD11727|nr:replication-relaxation family protein [Sphingomonas sp.]MBN8807802.1 replication-relaxation family protein [Sphingomonas sp.]